MRGNETADTSAQTTGMRLQLASNLRLALAAIQDDEIFEKAGLVIVEGLDLDGAAGAPTRGEKPVSVGIWTRTDVLNERPLRVFSAADHKRDDASAVQQDQPADWPGEHEVAFAVFEVGVPPHLLRKREVAEQTAHNVSEHVDRRLATLPDTVCEVGSAGGFGALERIDFD